MTNNLTFWCVIEGESLQNPFSMKVPLSTTVDDLKVAIKLRKPNDLQCIHADNLTLWQVSIPDGSAATSDALSVKMELNS